MIDRKEIERIASLAKLDVSREDESFFAEINDVMKIMEKFAQIQLDAIEYKTDRELIGAFREDEGNPTAALSRELVLANAPEVEAGCISAPKTAGKGE